MRPDPIQSVQSVVVAIVLGAVLTAWAFQHFHEFRRPDDIRFSVPRQRYLVALGVHVSAILTIYAIAILAIYVIYQLMMLVIDGIPPLTCYRPDHVPDRLKQFCKEFGTLKPDVLVWSAL